MARRTLPDPLVPLGYRRDGRPIYPILGADGRDPSNDPSNQPPAPARTFTQDEVSQLLAREKQQGGRSAVKELLEQLGFDKADDLSAYLQQQRDAEKASLSEVERREKEANDRLAAAAAREAAAAAAERSAQRRVALVALGATGDDLADAERLLAVPDDADSQALAEAAQQLTERRPELFGGQRQTASPPAPGGSPAGGPPPRGSNTPKQGSAGLDMARRRGYISD
ncbi:hypothetical protein GCM10020367_21080 [Streptomyces sannanensis]|uniref:Uncharacterized protein n=1 Tax=Streptomyces sannanensis TaxID=285536 RepID=A0ABP6S9G5_9ACTN